VNENDVREYTPNSIVVRDAYVRGMRLAFIASEGEHGEEFDRWITVHDAVLKALHQATSDIHLKEMVSAVIDVFDAIEDGADVEASQALVLKAMGVTSHV
jgi:hypothetical protein